MQGLCFKKGTERSKWSRTENDVFIKRKTFIIRYPKGKESVTGYKYEPWHLRYVGKSIAQIIMSHGITLEEYYYTRAVQN
ncbi:D-alanyl-D-alanine carboxypeptidase family protein (plasmid) [Peribacillus sp. RS7]|jgi:D-alanyl-D-alanine carboxypeptidase|uniref:D-alanyl-D-alanine carboxypeptidase family protein n=1 Tax=Peribacillus sp. RS7 TaxID=3242679 RepID=UPI0035C172C6